MVAKLHGDMAEMEKKLDDETIQHEQSELTLSEVKELWENEKKALQQLTEKVCTKNMGTYFMFCLTAFSVLHCLLSLFYLSLIVDGGGS